MFKIVDREKKQKKKIQVTCSYCGKKFYKLISDLNASKSGLYFCCRQHKDLAQRISFGLKEIQPSHYGQIAQNYRKVAFREYPHECNVCGYDEDSDILEVHHIDGDHSNNMLDNLIILCPICHRKLTSSKYVLIDRKMIQLKNK